MAISKDITLDSGIVVGYWIAEYATLNMSTGQVGFIMRGYASKFAYDAGMKSVAGIEKQYNISADKTGALFLQVSAYLDSEAVLQSDFTGATIA